MNDLQKAEFDLLKIFVEICDKLDLRYYLVCGSALGAVKYGGFIPWDDDIDVGMPRRDYDVFMEKAQSLLPAHVFLQNHRTEDHYPHYAAKLRNSNTTFLEKTVAHLPINHGVFLDIFPLDGYPADPTAQKRLENRKMWFKLKQLTMFRSNCSLKIKMLRTAFRILGIHKNFPKQIAKFEKVAALPTDDAKIWCNHGNWQGKLEYAPCWHYGDGVSAQFEGLTVCVPENFDAYLTQKYGDWRADLPESEKKGHHYYAAMDLNMPYEEFIKNQG